MTPDELDAAFKAAVAERAASVRVPGGYPRAERSRARWFWGAGVVTAAATAVAVAVAASPPDPRPVVVASASSTPSPSTTGRSIVSRVRSYCTIDDLVGEAETVVVATATGESSDGSVGAVAVRTTRLDVSRVLRGTDPGAVMSLRQTPAGGPVVENGAEYVVFARRLDDDSDEWAVVGVVAGLFKVENGSALRLDAESPSLPAEIAMTEFVELISRATPRRTC